MIVYTLMLLLLPAGTTQSAPPDSLTLQYCYQAAFETYPTAKNIDLQQEITDLNTRIAHIGYYPDLQLTGKATYQSEVTEFGTPSGTFPSVSKDQYEAALELNQPIYNGGITGIKKDLEQARGRQEIQSTRVELHRLRTQINDTYFGILLSKQQAAITNLLMETLQEQLSTVRARVERGALLPSQQHILQAELIKVRQDSADIQSNIRAGYAVLGKLIGEEIATDRPLSMPSVQEGYASLPSQRPEQQLFESTRQVLEGQRQLSETQMRPKLFVFGRAAYGRPGLNFLNDDFHDYYIGGLRLQWNFKDVVSADYESQALKIQQQKVMRNEEAFLRQLDVARARLTEQITSLRDNIQRDEQIIELRQQVVDENASQLKNGTITATEYITELNRMNQARLSMILNRVRLSKAKVEYMTTTGQPLSN